VSYEKPVYRIARHQEGKIFLSCLSVVLVMLQGRYNTV
jgi:hypothetical protein